MIDLKTIQRADPELYESMVQELKRQQLNLELIASENIVSPAVMAAAGSHYTNKYAEGYPHNRYYGGCMYVDKAEELAIERAKELFGASYANVQPHSGSNANLAAYFSLLSTGDTILGMSLSAGGHLTHGAKVSVSGKAFKSFGYGVNEDGYIDYNEVAAIAEECRPKLIVAGASAYPRIIDFAKFRKIADSVGAYLMVDMAHIAGLVAAGLHPNPMPYAHIVTSTTHKTLRGPRGGLILTNDADIAKKIDKTIFPGTQGGPLMHIIAAKAIAFKEAQTEDFKQYQRQIVSNAAALADGLMKRGINLISGGTDNHLMLVNLLGTGVTGKQLEVWLDEAHITLNKNAIPMDPEKPSVTSGVRIGTPAVTSRGMDEKEMKSIADCVADVIQQGESAIPSVRERAIELCMKHPIYENDVWM